MIRYNIIASDPLATWGETYTEPELIAKFWGYAVDQELFDEARDYAIVPEWFNLVEIQETWQLELQMVKPTIKQMSKLTKGQWFMVSDKDFNRYHKATCKDKTCICKEVK